MPAVATLPKRHKGRKQPEKPAFQFKAVNLDSAGDFLTIGGTGIGRIPEGVVAAFGRSRFTREDQEANPTAQMTRVVKDVVPVIKGGWKVGYGDDGKIKKWEPTRAELQQIVADFKACKARGVIPNLGKSHGKNDVIPTDELIAEIDDVVEHDGRLWASSYVSPPQNIYLSNSAMKVSAGIRWNWDDGMGNTLPIHLLHVAVTDNPIVSGQGRFVNLSAADPESATIADPVVADDPEPTDENTGGDLFSQMLEICNRSLALLGLPELPEDVSEDTLPLVMGALLGTLEPAEDETDDPDDPANDPATIGAGVTTLPALNPARGADMPAELTNVEKPTQDQINAAFVNLSNQLPAIVKANETLTQQVADLSNTVKALQTDKTTGAKAAYELRLADLGTAGLPAAVIENFKKIGESTGYDLSNLAGLETIPGINMSQLTKKLANGAAPPVAGVTKPMTKEEITAGVDLLLQGVPREKTAA